MESKQCFPNPNSLVPGVGGWAAQRPLELDNAKLAKWSDQYISELAGKLTWITGSGRCDVTLQQDVWTVCA